MRQRYRRKRKAGIASLRVISAAAWSNEKTGESADHARTLSITI